MQEAFPKVLTFNDYHEIEEAKDVLRHFVKGVCAAEVFNENDEGAYYGLFWIRGNKPSKADVKEMMERARRAR